MLLKNQLIEFFKKAYLENNLLLKENIVLKWVHRFGIDSLNELLIHAPVQKKKKYEQEIQEQITLIDEVGDEEDTVFTSLEILKTSENLEQKKSESCELEKSNRDELISKNLDPNKINYHVNTQNSPLPSIKNLRKWISNDKKAS